VPPTAVPPVELTPATATSTAFAIPAAIPVTGVGPSHQELARLLLAVLASGAAAGGGWLLLRRARRPR
jgi:hypothetical protein